MISRNLVKKSLFCSSFSVIIESMGGGDGNRNSGKRLYLVRNQFLLQNLRTWSYINFLSSVVRHVVNHDTTASKECLHNKPWNICCQHCLWEHQHEQSLRTKNTSGFDDDLWVCCSNYRNCPQTILKLSSYCPHTILIPRTYFLVIIIVSSLGTCVTL